MNRSEKLDKIVPALFLVKKELESVKKTSKNPFFKSRYADLNAHLDLVEPLLEKHGCFLIQPPQAFGTESISETYIIHAESGQFIGGSMSLLVAKSDMQQLGAAATYARRFVLSGLLSMKAEDDDGNSATGKVVPTVEVKPKTALPTTSSSSSFKSGGFSSFSKKKETSKPVESDDDENKKGDLY